MLKPLVEKFPNENFVYFADNQCMPYGNKSPRFLKARLTQIIEYLQQNFNIKLAILACNTASAVACEELNSQCKVKVLGLNLAQYTGVVLCTKLTSKFYPNLTTIPCPRLAKYIEDNYFDKPKLQKRITSLIKSHDLHGSITLGCTHYELVAKYFKQSLSGEVRLPASDFVNNLSLDKPNTQSCGSVVMLASIPTKSYIDKLWRIFKG